MQRRRPIVIDTLNFSNEQIAFFEECPHLQLITGEFPPLNATWQIDGTEGKIGMRGTCNVDFPSSCTWENTEYLTEDQVACLRCVACEKGLEGEEAVCEDDAAC